MSILNLFQPNNEFETYSAGQTIFMEGDAGEVMYVIMAGVVDILVRGKVIYSAETGELVGEMALIDSKPRSATAIAKTDCKLVSIDECRFSLLVRQTPGFALEVMRLMAGRLRHMNQSL